MPPSLPYPQAVFIKQVYIQGPTQHPAAEKESIFARVWAKGRLLVCFSFWDLEYDISIRQPWKGILGVTMALQSGLKTFVQSHFLISHWRESWGPELLKVENNVPNVSPVKTVGGLIKSCNGNSPYLPRTGQNVTEGVGR